MKIYKNISELLTLTGVSKKDGRKLLPNDLSIIKDAAVVFNQDEIVWVGQDINIPREYSKYTSFDCTGYCLTPELIDCHTHLIFGGDRSQEYSMRLNGADYQEIAKAGGGILATQKMTNSLSNKELIQISSERIEKLYSQGVGTIEIKSGYSLTLEGEKRLSLIISELKYKYRHKIQIINTFMAAHAIPKEFGSGIEYLKKVVIPLLDDLEVQKAIDCADIFHEKDYFSYEDTEFFFNECTKRNIPIKSHADEFQDNDGAALAVKHKALSTDHLLCSSTKGIKALANATTVAVGLPGTGFFLGKPQVDMRKFLDAGVKVAIGSDYNPGSCHCDNVLLIASFAAPQYKMNIAELWASITYNAAHALGLKNQAVIEKGRSSRFSLFKCNSVSEITYSWGVNLAKMDLLI